MTNMKRAATSDDFVVDSWEFQIDINTIVGSAVQEAIRNSFADEPPIIDLLGAAPDEPITVQVSLPVFSFADIGPTYHVTLIDLIDEAIDLYDDDPAALEAIGSQLKAIADKILRQ